MTKEERLSELRRKLDTLNHHYYTLDNPLVSDALYDRLFRELEELERELGQTDPESPTQTVGGALSGELKHRTHYVPMLSLANLFCRYDEEGKMHHDELEDWYTKLSNPLVIWLLVHSERRLTISLNKECCTLFLIQSSDKKVR